MKLKSGNIKLNEKIENMKKNKHIYDFQQFETIISFGDSIYTGKISWIKTIYQKIWQNLVRLSPF